MRVNSALGQVGLGQLGQVISAWFEVIMLGPNLFIYTNMKLSKVRPPGFLGIWGEWLFIFRELRSTDNYFQGFGEQANSFGDLGSPAKKYKKSHLKGKAFISFDFLKKIKSSASGGKPQAPLSKSKSVSVSV